MTKKNARQVKKMKKKKKEKRCIFSAQGEPRMTFEDAVKLVLVKYKRALDYLAEH